MIRFENDYLEGAHPDILKRLLDTNLEQTAGYGADPYCEHARSLIRGACRRPDADVHFLIGGTQTNAVVISSILRPHQGVICASTGHINVHESGAVEAGGHKVLALPSADGKLTAGDIAACCERHYQDGDREHMVQPAMVYLSQPTENGTLYSAAELSDISAVCRRYGLPLYLDGARLSYGLASPRNDLSLSQIASCCDVFYIGGTKTGALFGEAVVITNPALKRDFRYLIKQHGALLAKGRLLGLQFETLFTGDLYLKIAGDAVRLALDIRRAFAEKGISFYYDSYTNQQFPILRREQLLALSDTYSFSPWCDLGDGRYVVRFCTSWATTAQNAERLCEDIRGRL